VRELGELARELVEPECFEIPAGEVEESEGGLEDPQEDIH
jgi:hypothetical protein